MKRVKEEEEDYKPTNSMFCLPWLFCNILHCLLTSRSPAALAIYPNGQIEKTHYAFITVDTNWSFDEMNYALLRAASESDIKSPGGYKAISSSRLSAVAIRREEGLNCPDLIVEEGNYKEMLKLAVKYAGNFVLVADMRG